MSLIGTALQFMGVGVAASAGGVLVVQRKLIGEVLDELSLRLWFWRPRRRRPYTARHRAHDFWVPASWTLQ